MDACRRSDEKKVRRQAGMDSGNNFPAFHWRLAVLFLGVQKIKEEKIKNKLPQVFLIPQNTFRWFKVSCASRDLNP